MYIYVCAAISIYIHMENGTNRNGNFCLFAANGQQKGQRKIKVCFPWSANDNGNRHLLFQQTCPSMVKGLVGKCFYSQLSGWRCWASWPSAPGVIEQNVDSSLKIPVSSFSHSTCDTSYRRPISSLPSFPLARAFWQHSGTAGQAFSGKWTGFASRTASGNQEFQPKSPWSSWMEIEGGIARISPRACAAWFWCGQSVSSGPVAWRPQAGPCRRWSPF